MFSRTRWINTRKFISDEFEKINDAEDRTPKFYWREWKPQHQWRTVVESPPRDFVYGWSGRIAIARAWSSIAIYDELAVGVNAWFRAELSIGFNAWFRSISVNAWFRANSANAWDRAVTTWLRALVKLLEYFISESVYRFKRTSQLRLTNFRNACQRVPPLQPRTANPRWNLNFTF